MIRTAAVQLRSQEHITESLTGRLLFLTKRLCKPQRLPLHWRAENTATINPELLTGSIIGLLKKQCYSFAKWSQAYNDPDDIHEAFFDEFNGCVPDFTNEIMEYIKEATAESQEDWPHESKNT